MAKFYKCAHCGNIITKLNDSGVSVTCCGEPMEEIVPGAVDGSKEKHIPIIEISGSNVLVMVGSVAHPMTPEHLIDWIALETDKGIQIKQLTATDKPKASFTLSEDETVKTVYAYCNLHGLWKA